MENAKYQEACRDTITCLFKNKQFHRQATAPCLLFFRVVEASISLLRDLLISQLIKGTKKFLPSNIFQKETRAWVNIYFIFVS